MPHIYRYKNSVAYIPLCVLNKSGNCIAVFLYQIFKLFMVRAMSAIAGTTSYKQASLVFVLCNNSNANVLG
jgi:hypothetical protein